MPSQAATLLQPVARICLDRLHAPLYRFRSMLRQWAVDVGAEATESAGHSDRLSQLIASCQPSDDEADALGELWLCASRACHGHHQNAVDYCMSVFSEAIEYALADQRLQHACDEQQPDQIRQFHDRSPP